MKLQEVIINGGKVSYVKVTMSPEVAARVAAAFCKNYKYQAYVLDADGNSVPNPETLQEFIFRQRKKFILDNLKTAEVPDLAKADRATREAEIDALSITFELIQE